MTAYTDSRRSGPPQGGKYIASDTVTDASGVVWLCVDSGFPGTFVAIAPTVVSTLTTQAVTGPLTSTAGVGTAGSSVTAVERGEGNIHKTVLTITAKTVTLTDDPGVGQFGSALIYTLPEGHVVFLGAVVDVVATLLTPFVDAWEGDVGLGIDAPTAGDALATTKQNIVPTTAVAAAAAKIGQLEAISSAPATVNGTSAPVTVRLNLRVDDDAAHATTAANLLTGTVTLSWMHLGDLA